MSVAGKTVASKKSLTQKQSDRRPSTNLNPDSHLTDADDDRRVDTSPSRNNSSPPKTDRKSKDDNRSRYEDEDNHQNLADIPVTTSQVQGSGQDGLRDALSSSNAKIGSSIADSKLRDEIEEIRHRREEQRKKDQSFFRDQRQAQLAKKKEEELLKAKAVQLKENRRRRRHSRIKKVIVDYRQDEHEKRTNIDKEYNNVMAERTKKRQEEIKMFLKSRNKELEQKFKEDHEKFLKQEAEKVKLQKVKDKGESKFKESKNEKYVGDWEQTKKDREEQIKILDLTHSAPFQTVFKLYDSSLYYLYKYFSALDIDPFLLNTPGRGGGGSLQYRNFLAMMNMFQILGSIIDVTEMKVLYRSLTHGKLAGGRLPIGLSYEEFREALVRILAKRREIFSKYEGAIKNGTEPAYLKNSLHYIEILDPAVHLYKDIENERDHYRDIDKIGYQDLENLFNYLALPQSVDAMNKLFETLRRRYQKAKPERLKELPKKAQYEKIHMVNQIIKEKRAKLYGPSQTTIARERSRRAKEFVNTSQRERGLRNKSAMSKSRIDKEESFEKSQQSQRSRKSAKK